MLGKSLNPNLMLDNTQNVINQWIGKQICSKIWSIQGLITFHTSKFI